MKIDLASVMTLLSCPYMVTGFTVSSPSSSLSLSSHSCYEKVEMGLKSSNNDEDVNDRRSFINSMLVSAGAAVASTMVMIPIERANAGIDVSGLPTETGGKVIPNTGITSQLKSFDGSASTRINEIKSSSGSGSVVSPKASAVTVDDSSSGATWAYRANPGFPASTSRANPLGTIYRYSDQIAAPAGSKRRSLSLEFEFPSDWLQLDKNNGGIQYVDQRNGDKLYVFRATLPEGSSLATLPKATIGDLIFDLKGSYVKTGQTVEEYKVINSEIITQCDVDKGIVCATRRRFKMKFATVTGNGLRVERRSLVDAYEMDNNTIYMMMTSTNAVKFEKGGPERETAENIAASFRID